MIAAKTRSPRCTRRRRGAVLIEFVMIVPLIATILGLTFFFGWAMRNQQKVKVSDRYACWRKLHCDNYPKHPTENRFLTLNEMFFANKAGGVGEGGWQGPMDSLEEFVESTSQFGDQTHKMAEHMVLTQSDPFPRGKSATVSASFPTTVGLWKKFQGPIEHMHARDGKEWVRGDITYLEPIKDLFLHDLDEQLLSIEHPQLRENLRRLYLKRW